MFDTAVFDTITHSTETTRNGTQKWYRDNLLHRIDGPALISPYGSEYWYKDGELHREDGPAATLDNGTEFWYKNGREVNPPEVEQHV